jgi:hypothetical protein
VHSSQHDTNSSLLTYADIIDIDGWHTLRNLDLAAYDRLIKTPDFELEIQKRASRLASRLSIALAPLFGVPNYSPGTSDSPHNNEVPSTQEDEDQLIRFSTLFESALTLKTATITTSDEYRFVINAPATSDDNESVHPPLPESNFLHNRTVKAATLEIFPRSVSSPRDQIFDATAQALNFIAGSTTKVPSYSKDMLLPKVNCVNNTLGKEALAEKRNNIEKPVSSSSLQTLSAQGANSKPCPANTANTHPNDPSSKPRHTSSTILNLDCQDSTAKPPCFACSGCGMSFGQSSDLKRHCRGSQVKGTPSDRVFLHVKLI